MELKYWDSGTTRYSSYAVRGVTARACVGVKDSEYVAGPWKTNTTSTVSLYISNSVKHMHFTQNQGSSAFNNVKYY